MEQLVLYSFCNIMLLIELGPVPAAAQWRTAAILRVPVAPISYDVKRRIGDGCRRRRSNISLRRPLRPTVVERAASLGPWSGALLPCSQA